MNRAASKSHLGYSLGDATAFDNRALAYIILDLTQKPRWTHIGLLNWDSPAGFPSE